MYHYMMEIVGHQRRAALQRLRGRRGREEPQPYEPEEYSYLVVPQGAIVVFLLGIFAFGAAVLTNLYG